MDFSLLSQAGYVSQRIRLFVLSVARRTAQHSGSCMDRAGAWRLDFGLQNKPQPRAMPLHRSTYKRLHWCWSGHMHTLWQQRTMQIWWSYSCSDTGRTGTAPGTPDMWYSTAVVYRADSMHSTGNRLNQTDNQSEAKNKTIRLFFVSFSFASVCLRSCSCFWSFFVLSLVQSMNKQSQKKQKTTIIPLFNRFVADSITFTLRRGRFDLT